MADNALIVDSGKVLMGKLLRGEDVEGITHCALGSGDGTVVKEVGFFGGNVEYVGGVTGPVAENGIYHEVDNPDGEVLVPGYLYEVRNIPDFNKGANTMLELVAIVKL